MEQKKLHLRESARNFLLQFLDDEKEDFTSVLNTLTYAEQNKNYTVLQVETENQKIETLAGWIVKINDLDTIVLKVIKANTFLVIRMKNIRKISIRK
ncbi:hypothetical protein SAMN02745116_01965 [Pilibacter termitis]|jgi:hypothetical protein|uniref:YolD-like protein n=1 Tax=Pilibacter termitis TaxID=263852 RepID=A0A1T4PWV5_9ENTE|nr:hypothetical protein [Pilibacter termitis]SJZ95992.1 hypothetical protein SAMN02745116_01965 [Pilibacter termitis]